MPVYLIQAGKRFGRASPMPVDLKFRLAVYARKFWRHLLADEQRGQAFAYWLP